MTLLSDRALARLAADMGEGIDIPVAELDECPHCHKPDCNGCPGRDPGDSADGHGSRSASMVHRESGGE